MRATTCPHLHVIDMQIEHTESYTLQNNREKETGC